MSAIISIKSLSKTYKGNTTKALDNLSLQINEGEVFGVLGPNGAGKTTLLNILCGLIQPSEGKVEINGLNYKQNRREIQQLIGVIPQEYALYPTLTARENLYYFGSLFGIKPKILKQRIEQSLDTTGLIDFADKKISSFSGGMKRRINILSGILHEPKIVFLDEPTVGVDIQSKKAIMKLLDEMHQKGATLVYTSHLLNEAQLFCTKIAIVDNSRLITIGKPEELIGNVPDARSLEDVFLHYTGIKTRDYV